jgi:hypothetical protein
MTTARPNAPAAERANGQTGKRAKGQTETDFRVRIFWEWGMMRAMEPNDTSLTYYENWLLTYIDSLECTDPGCRQAFAAKRIHSFRVAGEIAAIGARMQLDPRTLFLSRIIGLLHDTGRFEQYRSYGTFNDFLSLDHGDLGARIIEGNGALKGLDAAEKKTVVRAIRWHNKISLPGDADDKTLFYARLIRDADKLDIFRVVLENFQDAGSFASLPPATDVSDAILEDLMAGRRVSYKDLRNSTEMRLMQLNWITEIEFRPTLELIERRGYVDRMAASLPNSEKIRAFAARMHACLKDRLNPSGDRARAPVGISSASG